MTLTPRYVTGDALEDSDGPDFSVCTLVRSQQKYDRLLASFARTGFTADNSEFIAADNRETNRFDGYDWQNALLAQARGRYVVFCHDDIELLDQGHDALLSALEALTRAEPTWLLAGVARRMTISGAPATGSFGSMRRSSRGGSCTARPAWCILYRRTPGRVGDPTCASWRRSPT